SRPPGGPNLPPRPGSLPPPPGAPMHAAKTMTAALVTVARIHPLPSFSSECNGQAETQVQTTATGGAALTGERPSAVSGAFSIPGGAPVYTSMSALPDRDRSGQARVDEPALVARALAADLAAGGPLPDAETERLALGDRLRAALDELPEHYRVAVVLFDVEGYSHAEIAEILGVASGTVRSAVFHARRKLRALLDDLKEDR